MAGPESRLQRRIRKALQAEFGGFWYKVWGGPFQPKGLPDLYGVVRPPGTVTHPDGVTTPKSGRPVHVEVKTSDGVISAVQIVRMRELADAGAAVCVATTPEDAVRSVRFLLQDDRARFCLNCNSVRDVGAVNHDEHETWLSCAVCDRALL